MSDDRDDIGRGRPPKENQFKKGQSGNPRGRPRKPRRADIPSQIGRDLRALAQRRIRTKISGEEVDITLAEAVLFRIISGALDGKISQQRMFLNLWERGLQENVARHPEYEIIDGIDRELRDMRCERDAGIEQLLDHLARKSKKFF